MKTKVNPTWLKQLLACEKGAIKEEIRLVKLQHERYFNYPMPLEEKTGYSKEKIFSLLNDAIKNLGTAEVQFKKYKRMYEPCEDKKPDFAKIEAYIKNNAKKIDNYNIGANDYWDFYAVVSRFFCLAKWGVPESEKNNDRVYGLMYKYCQGY